MPRQVIKGAAGLMPSISDLVAPDNKLAEAINVLIKDNGVIEPRLGIRNLDGYEITSMNGLTTSAPYPLFQYGSTLMVNPVVSSVGTLYRDNGTGWTAVSFTDLFGSTPDIRTPYLYNQIELQQNLYLPSEQTAGVWMIDAAEGPGFRAGFRTPPPIENLLINVNPATIGPSGDGIYLTGAFLWEASNHNAKVAYRVVWGRKDAHKRVILSAPSGRTVRANTSGAAASVYGDVPAIPEVSDSTFYQVYRSKAVDYSVVTSAVPSDDMYLVYEGLGVSPWTGGTTDDVNDAKKPNGGSKTVTVYKANHGLRVNCQIYVTFNAADVGTDKFENGLFRVKTVSTNSFTYEDNTANSGVTNPYRTTAAFTVVPKSFPFFDYSPDTLLTNPLYTNPIDGDGIGAANDLPPCARTLASWKGRLWFGNTKKFHKIRLKLLGVYNTGTTGAAGSGADTGLRDTDTITIDGVTYTFKDAPTAGVLTDVQITKADIPSVNVDTTARALVKAINYNPTNTTTYAYYVSGDNDLPGDILITAREYDAFNVTVSRSQAWNPYKIDSATHTADDEAFVNRLYYSKPNQPEAVPELQYMDIGAANRKILRIAALKEALFVFKEDGVYTVTGDYPFRVDLLDSTVVPLQENTIVAGDAAIYGLFNAGVCRINGSGISIVNGQISKIQRDFVSSTSYPNIGLLNEQDGFYLVSVVEAPTREASVADNASNKFFYCFNIRSKAWTRLYYATAADSEGVYLGSSWSAYETGNLYAATIYKQTPSSQPLLILGHSNISTTSTMEFAREYKEAVPALRRFQYFDGGFTVNTKVPTSVATTSADGIYTDVFTFSDNTWASTPNVGDFLYMTSHSVFTTAVNDYNVYGGIVTDVGGSGLTLTCRRIHSELTSLPSGAPSYPAARLYYRYLIKVQYDLTSPDSQRHYRDVTFFLQDFAMLNPELVVRTDHNSTEDVETFAFSDESNNILRAKRVLWPAAHQYATSVAAGLQLREAGSYFKLVGIAATYENVSERNSR